MTRLLLALALASPAYAGCEPLVLAWDESPGAHGYNLYRWLDGEPQPPVWVAGRPWEPPPTEWEVDDPPGIWTYQVSAQRGMFESEPSNTVLAEIRPLDPGCDEPVECELGIERQHVEVQYGRHADGTLDVDRTITSVTTLVGWPVCEEGP